MDLLITNPLFKMNIFEIWFKPTYDKEGKIDSLEYVYKPWKYKSLPFPMLLQHLLNTCCKKSTQQQGDVSDLYSNGYYPIGVILHSAQDMLTGQASNSNDICGFGQLHLENKNDADIIYPIIHITLPDLFVHSFYGTEALPKPVPRSYMIMDNSIWNYLVPITGSYYIKDLSRHYENRDKHNFEEWLNLFESSKKSNDVKSNYQHQSVVICLGKALKSICNNYSKQLYRLKVAREYADLNARLTLQSFLSGAHASGVAPFIFHSESCTKDLIMREFRSGKNGELPSINEKYVQNSLMERLVKNRKWRILLLDDKAVEPMDYIDFIKTDVPNNGYKNTKKEDNTKERWNCKLKIIRDILEFQLNLKGKVFCSSAKSKNTNNIPKDNVILIEYAQNLKDAINVLKEKKYDIVLLDYLLNQSDGVHYGYELLEKIYNDQQQHKKDEDNLLYKSIKPHRHLRLYCMFISAYSSAVHDRLFAEGLNQSEKFWFINLGACPTNTPQLFLYNLLKLMEKRIEDAHISRLSIDGVIEVLENIFKDKFVRKNAGELYQKIQSLQYYYRNLLQDYDISVGKERLFETKKSVLVTHFLNDYINMGGLLEHLAQLVHLTAFGTIRQWPEMWEEYLYVKAQLKALISEKDKKRLDKLCDKIEGYILDLKSSAL